MNHVGNEHGLWDPISTLAFVTSVCIGCFGRLAKVKDDPNFEAKKSPRTIPSSTELPSHVQRELYKEDRREIMRPRITRKSPMYDNIRMLDVDGNVLSTISQKKAQWYLKHPAQLAKEIDPHTIQLNFRPHKHNHQQEDDDDDDRLITEYNASIKRNCCVGCGDETSFMRHYVVPYCYRSRFPNAYKTHLPHDVVILCPHCHMHAERAAHQRMQSMEHQLRQQQNYPPETAQPELFDPQKQAIRNAATALLKWKTKLPPIKIQEYEHLIAEYYHLDYQQQQSIPETVIQEACQLETRKPNPNYVSGVDLVIDSLLLKHPRTPKTDPKSNGNHSCQDDADAFDQVLLTHFIREWRKNFVESIQPRFLPTAWSVDAPVQCHNSR